MNQITGYGGQISGHAGGGGMGAVNGAKSVGDIKLGHIGQGFGKLRRVLFLADIEPKVFKQHNLARLQRGGFRLRVGADDIFGKDDLPAQEFTQADGHRSKAQGFLPHTLRLSKMRAGDDRCVVLQQGPDGRQRGNNALVVGNGAGLLVLRHVEVTAEENLFSVNVHIVDCFLIVIQVKSPFISPSPHSWGKSNCRSAS
ncbi:hypothetical protein SDC9_68581 [bioreactor metagenome]|uniref:Uncharacterized protein n=1 Tax=bioreactor metagenome TaxID=1076179 RepID=A0A644Y0T8_9ZZZZ